MAGSAATGTNLGPISPGLPGDKNVIALQWDWLSDDAAGTVTNLGPIPFISGTVIGYKAIPGAGAVAPTNLYDVTIKDADGATVLTATDNLAASANRGVASALYYLFNDTLYFNVAAAGNAKEGTFIMFVRLE